jgi:hypothetical protein
VESVEPTAVGAGEPAIPAGPRAPPTTAGPDRPATAPLAAEPGTGAPTVALAATPVPTPPAEAAAGGLTAKLPEAVAGGETAAVSAGAPVAPFTGTETAPPIAGAVVATVLSAPGREVWVTAPVLSSRRAQPAAATAQATRTTAEYLPGMRASLL